MKDRPRVQDFDWTLLAIVAAITGIGVLEIYSSTHASAMAGIQWKQVIWIGLGLIGMFVISRIDYHTAARPGARSIHGRHRYPADCAGDRPFSLRGEALGLPGRRLLIYKCQSL